jgi:hypothetical protein
MRLLLAVLLLASALPAQEPDYLRYMEDKDGASSLQTAITSFTNAAGATVDLVSAVHIADKAYFTTLNQRFLSYDAVLYELVGGPMPKEGDLSDRPQDPKLAWIASMHQRLQESLALSSQLHEIDYRAANFVHADMTIEQFLAAREQKSESFLGLLFKAMDVQNQLDSSGGPGLVKLLEILVRQDSADDLKRMIGREFDSVENLIAGLEAGEGTVIITERNRIALEKLQAEIKRGQKRLAIFYGAAHLPSMEKELLKLGYTKMKTEWVKAWAMPKK